MKFLANAADPTSGISLGDPLKLPKRHPACVEAIWSFFESRKRAASHRPEQGANAELIRPIQREGSPLLKEPTRVLLAISP